MPPEYVLAAPVGGVGQVEPSSSSAARALASAAAQVEQPADQDAGSRAPVRSSSTEAYWPVRPIGLAHLVRPRVTTS